MLNHKETETPKYCLTVTTSELTNQLTQFTPTSFKKDITKTSHSSKQFTCCCEGVCQSSIVFLPALSVVPSDISFKKEKENRRRSVTRPLELCSTTLTIWQQGTQFVSDFLHKLEAKTSTGPTSERRSKYNTNIYKFSSFNWSCISVFLIFF